MSLAYEGDSTDQGTPGIFGTNSAGGTGVLGLSDGPGGIGVLGRSAGGIPVQAESTASPPGIAGLFIGDVSVNGNLTAQNITLLAGGGVQLNAPASGSGMLVSKLDGTNCGNLELRADTLSVTGNVGIGTPSPGSSLDVRGTVSVRGSGDLYFHRDDNFSGGSSIILDPPGAGTSDLSVQGKGGGPIAGFHVHAATSTFLDGSVGIGTTNPQRKLQIGDDVVGLSFDPGISPNAGVLRFGDNTGWKLHFGRSREASGAALNSGTDGLLMTIQDNGNVGIGTANPSHPLHVDAGKVLRIEGGTSSADTTDYFSFGGSGSFGIDAPGVPDGRFVVQNSGNVGIGTNTPRSLLEISASYPPGTGGLALTVTNTAGGAGAVAVIDFNTFLSAPSFAYNPSSRIEVEDDGNFANDIIFLSNRPGAPNNKLVERMRISPAGVGIGTNATPTATLEVNGTISSPMWSVSTPISQNPGPLPVSGSFQSKGGTLILFASGSAYRANAGPMIVGIFLDGVLQGNLFGYTNEMLSHKSLVSVPLVVRGIPPGMHSINLQVREANPGDPQDHFNVTVLELPFS